MESTVVLLVAVATTFFLLIFKWINNRKEKLNLLKKYRIPGPKPEFFFGNLKELSEDPVRSMTSWLTKYGNIFGYYLGEIPYVVINDLDILKTILVKDGNQFSNRPEMYMSTEPLSKTMIALRGQRWKEVRTIVTPTFSAAKMKLISGTVDNKIEVTVSKIRKIAESEEIFDMYEVVQALTLDVIASSVLAMKTDCQNNPKDEFLIAIRDAIRTSHNIAAVLPVLFPITEKPMAFLNKHLKNGQVAEMVVRNVKKAIASRRSNPALKRIDVLQLLLDHNEKAGTSPSNRLMESEIVANAYVFLLAGFETTATSLAFTFHLLITHPEIQERLYEEISHTEDASYNTVQDLQYLDQVFNESLRLYPPIHGFVSRSCEQDYKIGGITIPKGAKVQAPVWDIHHNPDFWPDPWKFDPDRFSPENKKNQNSMAFMAFGAGPRYCIGTRFALLEAKKAIFCLVKAFRFEKCEKTADPLVLTHPSMLLINPADGVYMRAVPRS